MTLTPVRFALLEVRAETPSENAPYIIRSFHHRVTNV
jgi:hypothetical protein